MIDALLTTSEGETEMRYEFWQHNTTGDLYAVALYEDPHGTSLIVATSEPLSHREVEQHNDPSDYEMTDDDAEWMQRRVGLFSTYEPE